MRLGGVAAARAEAAWLEGDASVVAAATEAALPLAFDRTWSSLAGELAAWRRRAGLDWEMPPGAAGPYALELSGEFAQASELWSKLGCPYEAGLALAAGEEEPLRRRWRGCSGSRLPRRRGSWLVVCASAGRAGCRAGRGRAHAEIRLG